MALGFHFSLKLFALIHCGSRSSDEQVRGGKFGRSFLTQLSINADELGFMTDEVVEKGKLFFDLLIDRVRIT